MKSIPEDINRRFVEQMKKAELSASLQQYYLKWLRFYLDFCDKYNHKTAEKNSLAFFIEKLSQKNQSEFNKKQASESILVYFDILKSLQTNPDESRKASSSSTQIQYPANDFKAWTEIDARIYEEIRLRNYSNKTFQAYSNWTKKFAYFLSYKLPNDVEMQDVKRFLTHLAVDKNVAATTQNQAFNALLFLFKHIFKRADEFDASNGIVRAKRKKYIPVVLSRNEVNTIIEKLREPYKLVVQLLYGCGLRLSEAINIRLHSLNLDENILTIHDGKGLKDRSLPIPISIKEKLEQHINMLRKLHLEDMDAGYAGTFTPNALDKKFLNHKQDFSWQWLFPAKTLTLLPETGERKRYHLHESHVQKAIRSAVKRCQLIKRATAHTFRHSFASHLLLANYDIRTIQKMMGHSDVRTTMIYLHTIKSMALKEQKSPLDF